MQIKPTWRIELLKALIRINYTRKLTKFTFFFLKPSKTIVGLYEILPVTKNWPTSISDESWIKFFVFYNSVQKKTLYIYFKDNNYFNKHINKPSVLVINYL